MGAVDEGLLAEVDSYPRFLVRVGRGHATAATPQRVETAVDEPRCRQTGRKE